MISILFVIFYKLNLNNFQNVQNFIFFLSIWNEDISDLWPLYCPPDLKLSLFVLPLPLKLALEVNLKENNLFKLKLIRDLGWIIFKSIQLNRNTVNIQLNIFLAGLRICLIINIYND